VYSWIKKSSCCFGILSWWVFTMCGKAWHRPSNLKLPKMDHCVYLQDLGHSNCAACGYGWFCPLLHVFVSCNVHVNLKNKSYFKNLKKKEVLKHIYFPCKLSRPGWYLPVLANQIHYLNDHIYSSRSESVRLERRATILSLYSHLPHGKQEMFLSFLLLLSYFSFYA
jgi:hypothetical protein